MYYLDAKEIFEKKSLEIVKKEYCFDENKFGKIPSFLDKAILDEKKLLETFIQTLIFMINNERYCINVVNVLSIGEFQKENIIRKEKNEQYDFENDLYPFIPLTKCHAQHVLLMDIEEHRFIVSVESVIEIQDIMIVHKLIEWKNNYFKTSKNRIRLLPFVQMINNFESPAYTK